MIEVLAFALAPVGNAPAQPAEPAQTTDAGDDDRVRVVVVADEADRRQRSSEAVDIVDTERAQTQSADLGEVLARVPGVGIRRSGGLGSDTRLSLAGLTGNQVPVFFDGIPIEFTGFGFGVANVPVNLVERVEVYRGVVPIRFGADALGGAVNLVTDRSLYGTHGSASYQGGSFDTHRLTAGASNLLESIGLYTGVFGFLDNTRGDYLVDVDVPNEVGQIEPATVRRFHDAYRAGGGGLEVGFIDRPWADRFLVRGFMTANRKDLQHNVVMSIPYGDVEARELSPGGSVTYVRRLPAAVMLYSTAGYAFRRIDFEDTGECRYDWFGRCALERPSGGEIGTVPSNTRTRQHGGFGRVELQWQLLDDQRLSFVVAPTGYQRRGRNRVIPPGVFDPSTARRDLLNMVTGADWTLSVWGDRLENTLFLKHYVQAVWATEPQITGRFDDASQVSHLTGTGDGVRLFVNDWAYLKASYEWAVRLPGPDEVFGNATIILDNVDLRPERSHNANLGATIDDAPSRVGQFRGRANLFGRWADDLIVLLGNDRSFIYDNVFEARALGVEAATGWTSPGDYVVLDANATYQDFRNASNDGAFAEFRADRIPNRPWLFANANARFSLKGIINAADLLSVEWTTRYVHPFFRGWESVGAPQFKQRIPPQVLHSVAAGYGSRIRDASVNVSLEIQNLLGSAAFDFFGVQRPGRAVFGKLVLDI